MPKAITRKATAVDEKIKQLPGEPISTAYYFDHLATREDVAVMVTEEDFPGLRARWFPASDKLLVNP
jgi:peroxin-6